MNDHETDRHLRDLARRFRDDVGDTVDLDPVQAGVTRRPRAPIGVVVAVLAALALVGVGIATQVDGDIEVAVDEEEQDEGPATTVPEPSEDFQIDGPGLALGAPDDGKDSVGLPVDADPKTGLTDGQVVTVYGADFPPNQSVGVVMCTREALRDHGGQGADACNLGHFEQGTSDADGNVTIDFSVRRLQTFQGEEIDCAVEAGRCIIGMGLLSDYDQSGGVEVVFDGSAGLPDPPTIELSATDGLADGEQVRLRVSGLVPGFEAFVEVCVADVSCTPLGLPVGVDEGGTIEADVRLWRSFGTWTEDGLATRNVDCAVVDCRLVVQAESAGNRAVPNVPLSFRTDGSARVAPTMRLLADQPIVPPAELRVEVVGLTGAGAVELQACSADAQQCFSAGQSQFDGNDTVVEVGVPPGAKCGGDCVLSGFVYRTVPSASEPPPLFPEPVTFTVAG